MVDDTMIIHTKLTHFVQALLRYLKTKLTVDKGV